MRELIKFYQILLLILLLMTAGIFYLTHSPAPEPQKPPQAKIEPLPEPSRHKEVLMFEATAYDLSIQCCGKPYGHPARGITADGYDLNGKTRAEAMTVSSNDFPAGTRIRLTFNDYHSEYNGVYTVRDTGNMKRGVLDVYVGDYGEEASDEAVRFGRQSVRVEIGGTK
ncbi:MAG: 3D domain-containing protein [Alphaproteobacteria bacterium]|nr:3D domain-containing protein [Alphaproteobacteria bacterium]